LRSDNLDSVGELYTEDDFRQLVVQLRRRQLLSAASASLTIMASAVLLERHPLERTVRWRTVANELSMTFVVRRCFQCSAGEVVESEQRVAIPDQALDRPVIFDAPGLDETPPRYAAALPFHGVTNFRP
jgi:hypothetical protein